MDKLKYYLGTGLKFEAIDPKFEIGEYELSSIDLLGYESLTGINVKTKSAELFHFEDVQFKMRPLSSLTKPIQVEGYNGGEPFVPLMKLFELYDTQSFSNNGEPRILFQPENVISCRHNIYDKFCKPGDEVHEFQIKYLVKTTNMGDLIYSFTYDPGLKRFSARDETHRSPLGVAHQFDMYELLFRWHFWIFDQSEFGKSLIEIKD